MLEGSGQKPRSRSGSEKRQRTKAKLVRLTDVETKLIEDAASNAGLTFSSYARTQMLGRPVMRSVRRPPIERELLARTLGQLGKIGSNLNQIAYAANIGEEPGSELHTVITEVREIVGVIRQVLGRSS